MEFAWEIMQDKTQVSTSCGMLPVYPPVRVYVYIIYQIAVVGSVG